MCATFTDFFNSNYFLLLLLFFGQDHITTFSLKKCTFLGNFWSPGGWCTYALICTLLSLSHYSYSKLTRNLENRKYKSYAFLSPNLKQIDSASFDIQQNSNYLGRELKCLHIFPDFPGKFCLYNNEHNVMAAMGDLGPKVLSCSPCAACS